MVHNSSCLRHCTLGSNRFVKNDPVYQISVIGYHGSTVGLYRCFMLMNMTVPSSNSFASNPTEVAIEALWTSPNQFRTGPLPFTSCQTAHPIPPHTDT